eukprot:CAMPEP_0197634308 /NCGR_PEP_ID=MMETSP1338-20131121/10434_1 /TAXON_ID=43686 ORGANISM="Pelagodinium beii, Strain RCC1491" /NCGR_SAMPLE_ID=MMETSP1338 /ASSEMBLY_ACC=CAM_ASM_000754 /LENGTH=654 /DNA_ID=CAMNT_0043206147 /DNA_START=74 /DNA_END=2038 /DNA_ORIENTATION=+
MAPPPPKPPEAPESVKSDAETNSDAGPTQKQVAYQAAADIVEIILDQGGKKLFEHYEARMIIHNTMVVACEAAYTKLDACFVPHDENPLEEESLWDLESEPAAGELDAWSAKIVEVRKPKVERSMERRPSWTRGNRNLQLRNDDKHMDKLGRRGSTTAVSPNSRAWPLQEKRVNPDAALEESFRQMWAQRAAERAMSQDEAAAEKNKEAKEESNRRAQVMEELEQDRPFAFDSEGRVMFFEKKDIERYPRVENVLQYQIPGMQLGGQRHVAGEDSASSSATAASNSKDTEPQVIRLGRRVSMSEEAHAHGQRAKKKLEPRHEFTDGCRKLEHAQPPLVETIQLERGVVLTSAGSRKAGVPAGGEGGRMAWREYVAMSQGWAVQLEEQEELEKTGASSVPSLPVSPTATLAATTPKGSALAATTPAASRTGATTPAASRTNSQWFPDSPQASNWGGSAPSRSRPASAHPTAGGSSVGGLLVSPSFGSTSTRAAAAAATAVAAMCYGSSWGQGVRPPPVQPVSAQSGPLAPNSPASPAPGLLASRAAAGAVASMGVLRSQPRQPRQKPVVIGGHGFQGAPLAPPLGATMGHGLIPKDSRTLREAVTKGQYYCPPKTSLKKADPRLTRASSAGSIRRPQSASVAEGRRSHTPVRAWR